METPFVFGRLATNENFTDRVDECRHLVGNFTSLVNTIIISPRRWGKSSLVHKASKQAMNADPKLRICHIDLFNVRSEAHFCQILLESVLKATSSKFEEAVSATQEFLTKIVPKLVLSNEPAPKYSIELDWEKAKKNMDEVLDLAEQIAIKKGLKLVICIDEFQNIAYFGDSLALQKTMRAHWQMHQHVSYCFFGSKRHMMLEVFASPSNPFYKFGDLIFLDKIPREDMKAFICKRFADTSKSIDGETAALIIELADNHPYYTQQLAQLAWLRSEERCDAAIVRQAHSGLVRQLSLLFLNITESLTNTQVAYLHALIDEAPSLSSAQALTRYGFSSATAVSRAKKSLAEKDLLDLLGPRPTIQDPLYAYWLKHDYFKN